MKLFIIILKYEINMIRQNFTINFSITLFTRIVKSQYTFLSFVI